MSVPTFADIEAAARRLAGHVWHTPLVRSAWLSTAAGGDVWLKLEIAQPTGSFKVRGALNALMRLRDAAPDARAVVAASAGNHGLAIAWAAKRLGLTARVYVPATAPAAKRLALGELGATLVEAASYEDAEAQAHAESARTGTPYISPYNHPDVIAGAGTIALEMLADDPDLDAIVAPLGGGGLLAATAIVARAETRPVAAIGAEAEASPAFTAALAAGHIVDVAVRTTLADGLAGNMEAGSQTFDLVRDLADRVALVAESSIEVAMRELMLRERLIAEGAGATGVAALMQGGLGLGGRRVGVIVSGRNVDGHVLRRVLGPPVV